MKDLFTSEDNLDVRLVVKAKLDVQSPLSLKYNLLSSQLLDDNTASLVLQIMLGRSKFTLELTDLQAKISVMSSDTTSLS